MLIGSYQDLKERLVDGYIWLILLILIIPVFILRLVLYWNNSTLIVYMIISITIGLIVAILMFIFGLWGGADILALICLSFLSPISLQLVTGLPGIYDQNFLELILPVSLSVVMNAALLQIPLPIVIFLKNYFQFSKNPEAYELPFSTKAEKIFASFLGSPLSIERILAKPIFHYQALEKNTLFKNDEDLNAKYPVPFVRLTSEPLLRWKMFHAKSFNSLNNNSLLSNQTNLVKNRQLTSKDTWSFDFSIGLKSEEEDLFRQRTILNQATNGPLKRKYLWVQYSIPFLIPMLVGYLLAFNGINILFELAKLFGILK